MTLVKDKHAKLNLDTNQVKISQNRERWWAWGITGRPAPNSQKLDSPNGKRQRTGDDHK